MVEVITNIAFIQSKPTFSSNIEWFVGWW